MFERGVALGVLLAALASAALAAAAPPDTRRDATTDTYFGETIADPYRWLENTTASGSRAWFDDQNTYTRATLDALPGRNALRQRLFALNTADLRIRDVQRAGDRIFFLRRLGNEQHHRLYVQEGLAGTPRLLIDPETYIPGDAGSALIEYYVASPNGRRIAFGVAQGGSEDSALHVTDVDTGKALGPPAPHARWASPVWRFDSTVLFYTQQQAWPAGTPAADLLKNSRAMMRTYDADGAYTEVPVFARGLDAGVAMDADDTPSVDVSPVSPFALGVIQHGTQNEQTLYVARMNTLRSGATPWRRLAGPERGIVSYDVRGEWIYLVTNENSPRYRVLRWSLNDPRPFTPADAEVVVAESTRVIKGVSVARDGLYVQQMDAGYSKLLRLEFNVRPATGRGRAPARGAPLQSKPSGVARNTEIRLPFAGAIGERVIDPMHPGALLRLTGWTEAPAYFLVDGKSGAVTRTPLLPPARVDWSGVMSTRASVRSHDGTAVPVSIVHARSQPKDGSARVVLDAYGAYGSSQEPYFWPSLLAWIERGGVLVVAHVRGGGELGNAWYRGGLKATKANTWRDAIAVGQWLVQAGWTSPARLAITGASAGGVAAGNAIIDAPELFAAMVSQVGLHDTLRSETGMVGPANVAEFGSVTTPEGFRDLLAMSSYARLRDGVRYPAALFTTGYNDPRVDPWDPGKMAARLQAVNAGPGGSGQAVLLRVEVDGGHGSGTLDQMVDETADVMAFLLWQTGAQDFALP